MSTSVSKKAILKALIDGVITELMVKTTGEMVYLDDSTTLSSKIAEMIVAINLRAKTEDVTAQIDALRQELLGDVPVEAYNTFTELANYISEHEDVATSLTEAIGNKADKAVVTDIQTTLSTLGSLATKSIITEDDLDSNLKAKVNAAAEGNHSHANQGVLDSITSVKVTNWDTAATNNHTHSNKEVIDDITAAKVAEWDASANNDHSHSNKGVIDGITSDKVSKWDSAVTNSHSHSNKDVIDDITSVKVSGWDTAATNSHTHSNKGALDNITATNVANWNAKSKVYINGSQPSGLTGNDLWFQTLQ